MWGPSNAGRHGTRGCDCGAARVRLCRRKQSRGRLPPHNSLPRVQYRLRALLGPYDVRSRVGTESNDAYERLCTALLARRRLVVARRVLECLFLFALYLVMKRGIGLTGLIGCGAAPLLFAIGFWVERTTERVGLECCEELRAMKFEICPHCEYDLRAIAEVPQCPECGRVVGPELNLLAWLKRLMPRASRRTIDAYRVATTSAPPSQTAPPTPASGTP